MSAKLNASQAPADTHPKLRVEMASLFAYSPFDSSQRSASIAAMHPVPAAVTA
jgi:hypothetical protein